MLCCAVRVTGLWLARVRAGKTTWKDERDSSDDDREDDYDDEEEDEEEEKRRRPTVRCPQAFVLEGKINPSDRIYLFLISTATCCSSSSNPRSTIERTSLGTDKRAGGRADSLEHRQTHPIVHRQLCLLSCEQLVFAFAE